ncbi:butyrophilin subfamily 1 member A1-like, partial [Plectropomus leopardus]|uniref:butyrophilin subfamily 1 member A1-like n=1 Tax=Plectropomus leopardus TaxID=160734 RepID=UPI001C4D21DB
PKVVIAQQDGEAILPCSLSTEENIELKLFDWKKTAPSDADRRKVFFYDGGIHYNNGRSGQSEQFKGRVSHFPEELKHGNASIIITNTKVTDSGEYTCDFPRLQPPEKYLIKLVVGRVLKDRTGENIPGAVSKPNIAILAETDDRVLLRCEVNGNPEPEVEWRDSSGNKLPAEKFQKQKRDGRFFITLNTTVTKTDCYRCVATQMNISHQSHAETFVRLN